MPRTGRRISWRKDLAVLERLDEHARLVRSGLPITEIISRQNICEATFFEDRQRLIALARESAGISKLEQMAEADAWLRQCIADADRLSAVREQSSTAKATHQANKRAAVDSFIKLWGLAKTAADALPEGSQIRRIVIEEVRVGDGDSAVETVVGGRGDLALPLPRRPDRDV